MNARLKQKIELFHHKMAQMSGRSVLVISIIVITLNVISLLSVSYILYNTHPLNRYVLRAKLEQSEQNKIEITPQDTEVLTKLEQGEAIAVHTRVTGSLYKGNITAIKDANLTLQTDQVFVSEPWEVIELTHRNQKVNMLYSLFNRLGEQKP